MFKYFNERRAASKRRNTTDGNPPAKRSFRNRKPALLSVPSFTSALSWGSAPSTPVVTLTPLVASPTFSYIGTPYVNNSSSSHRRHSSLNVSSSSSSSSVNTPMRLRRSSTTDLQLFGISASSALAQTMDDYFTFPPYDDATMNDEWTHIEQIDVDLEADLQMEGYDELYIHGVKV